jgi:multiple sugar transport system permease protein
MNEVRARGRLAAPGLLRGRWATRLTPYFMVIPPVLLLAALVAYPMLYNVTLSLRAFRTGEYVGLHNFSRAFSDPLFLASIRVTSLYVAIALAVEMMAGLMLALLVHRHIQSGAVRTLIYLLFIVPMVTPPIAAGVIARLAYTPTYGMVNLLLRITGLTQKDVLWLSSAPTAMFSVLSVDVWQWMPFVFLVCFAGFQAVPLDVLEAARVDGASGWQLFWQVEFPYLRTLLLLVLVFRFTDTFRVFDHVMVLTGGGPGAATEFLSLYLYRVAFKFFDLNYAAALSLYVLVVASFTFSFLSRLLGRETEG